MTDRYVLRIATDGVAEEQLIDLADLDQEAAEGFAAQLRGDTAEAREVGVPQISVQVPGGGALTFDPRAIATIDLEIAAD
jgi:hypothetical protein